MYYSRITPYGYVIVGPIPVFSYPLSSINLLVDMSYDCWDTYGKEMQN